MAQLTANTQQIYEIGEFNSLPVKAAVTIFLGSAIGIDIATGGARQLVAADEFKGFALAKADNASGALGDIRVDVVHRGLIQLAISALAITDEGKPVFASDGNTFTLTATGNTRIGTVYRWVSTGVAIVKFDACASRAVNTTTSFTDNTGGAVSDTLAAITAGAAYAQADAVATKNSISSLAAKVNTLMLLLK